MAPGWVMHWKGDSEPERRALPQAPGTPVAVPRQRNTSYAEVFNSHSVAAKK